MLGNLLLDCLVAALLLAGWYFWFRRRNRRRAIAVLSWIEDAFSGRGIVLRVRWQGASRFYVDLLLCRAMFRRASLRIQLQPREMPFHWALHRVCHRRETVTFEAELEQAPSLGLHVQNYTWHGRMRRPIPKSLAGWRFEPLGRTLITSRPDWEQEFGQVVETILAARSCHFTHVAFRRRAPHLVATAPLESLCPAARNAAMFEVLQELASSASTSTL